MQSLQLKLNKLSNNLKIKPTSSEIDLDIKTFMRQNFNRNINLNKTPMRNNKTQPFGKGPFSFHNSD